MRAYYGCTVTAEINWWGAASPDPNEFYAYQSTIDYLPALPQDPNAQSMVRLPDDNTRLSKASMASADLDKAYKLQLDGKFDAAIIAYDSYINDNSSDSKAAYALVRLDECYKLSGKEGAVSYIENTIKTKSDKNADLDAVSLELKNQYLLKEKRYDEAINNLDLLTKKHQSNKEVEKQSLFNAGYVYLQYMNDYKKAAEKFDQLAAKYPKDELVSESRYLLAGYDVNGNQQAKEATAELNKLTVPTAYGLDQNYPNPFNPATTISYQLPKSGYVTLKIFDMLGNEVKSLVNEMKEMGKYTATFDASTLASGMYVYQIKANDFMATKKMLLLK